VEVGCGEGKNVGITDGKIELGTIVGTKIGIWEGSEVDFKGVQVVGFRDGSNVGMNDGTTDNFTVGLEVGIKDDLTEGFKVGSVVDGRKVGL